MRMVGEFHEAFELPIADKPSIPGIAEIWLRQGLIDEEVEELRTASLERDIVEIADALADIIYIACGTALVYGINLEAVFEEVHRSNLSKSENGVVLRRDDGKVLKGPNWSPPDITRVLGLCAATWADGRCDRGAFARGFCSGHLHQTYRGKETHSALRTMRPRGMAMPELLDWAWSVCVPKDDCLLWDRATKNGYAVVTTKGGIQIDLHRLVVELTQEFDHSVAWVAGHECGNKNCIAPGHLRAVTSHENLVESLRNRQLLQRIGELEAQILNHLCIDKAET